MSQSNQDYRLLDKDGFSYSERLTAYLKSEVLVEFVSAQEAGNLCATHQISSMYKVDSKESEEEGFVCLKNITSSESIMAEQKARASASRSRIK
jgi:hypothetical protein